MQVNTGGDAVPVVYCLLNPDAQEQYVRLGRSFLVDEQNPDNPPVADSTLWNVPVTVYIEQLQDGYPVRIFEFFPADPPAKDSGFFPDNNLRLYKADFLPERFVAYRLYVHFPEDDRIVTAYTRIPGKPIIYDPLDMPGRKINLQSGVQFNCRWAPGNGGGVFQGLFILTYQEIVDQQPADHQTKIVLHPILGLGSALEITDILSGTRFFDEMAKQIPVKAGARRSVINVRFELFKGGEELALQVSPNLQQTTITSNLNEYTNLVNGIGIFSSMQKVTVNNLMLSNTTLNELARSELCKELGFTDISGGDPNLKSHEE